jgi:hypothetical protein
MEDQHVAIRVVEEAHTAHAGVDRLAEELDPARLQFVPRGVDRINAKRNSGRVGKE